MKFPLAYSLRACLVLWLTAVSFSPVRLLAQRPLGIDVSHWQGTINWSSVAGAGITFAWAKATEGASTSDAYFVNNAVNAKAAGVPIGAYHYAHSELNTPAAEAANFWSVAGAYIKGDGKSLMPMLDMEGGALS